METIDSFFHEKIMVDKKFIACYIEDDFFHKDFTLKMTVKIDLCITEINELISEYNKMLIDTVDVNNKKTRLYALRNNLSEIVRRLRESLCLDIRESKFEESMKKLINVLNK